MPRKSADEILQAVANLNLLTLKFKGVEIGYADVAQLLNINPILAQNCLERLGVRQPRYVIMDSGDHARTKSCAYDNPPLSAMSIAELGHQITFNYDLPVFDAKAVILHTDKSEVHLWDSVLPLAGQYPNKRWITIPMLPLADGSVFEQEFGYAVGGSVVSQPALGDFIATQFPTGVWGERYSKMRFANIHSPRPKNDRPLLGS
jgi:hypothetical protein